MKGQLKTSDQARGESARLVESGWAAWLVGEIRKKASQKFETTNPDNIEGLRDARMLFSTAAVVDSIIRDNAR